MGSLMESRLSAKQHELIKKVLIAQTNSLGTIELPIVEDLLRKHQCRSVLDIGCGEGSFVLELARRLRGVNFVGIDHNERAVNDALCGLRRRSLHNARFRTAFFDAGFERTKYDAILTRYTLQHASKPEDFMKTAYDRLKKKGLFLALESLDSYTDCQEFDPIWERFRSSVAAIHKRVGSNDNIGKSLGSLFRSAGLQDIRVCVVLCSPSTAGVKRFQAVVQRSAELAVGFFPDLFDQQLFEDLKSWLGDKGQLQQKDPYLCSAIASGTKPSPHS